MASGESLTSEAAQESAAGAQTELKTGTKTETCAHGVSLGQRAAALALFVAFYGGVLLLTAQHPHAAHRQPLDAESTAADRFAEGRAMRHVERLAGDIGGRQEGSPGLLEAKNYLKSEVEKLKERASSKLRFEIDESLVSGSFNLPAFVTRTVTMAYQNITNIAVRISAANSAPDRAAVLVNGHFDSGLHSPGASDCAACVACMLEVLRQIVDSDYIPSAPVIFLFNGGEEIFLKAVHGFVKTHPWAEQVGAMINLEASGSALPDTVVQSGPGTWPSRVYGESAVAPMSTVIAQDVFPLVPGETDYRIMCRDFDDVPGLDMVTTLRGYFYHTPFDTPENIL